MKEGVDRRDPAVLREFRKSVLEEASRLTHEQMRFYRIRQYVLYALVVALVVFVTVVLVTRDNTAADQRDQIKRVALVTRKLAVKTDRLVLAQRRAAQVRSAQVCDLFNRRYADSRRQYRQTVRYLKGLSSADRQDGINKAVAANLPQVRHDIVLNVPPDFCRAYTDRPK